MRGRAVDTAIALAFALPPLIVCAVVVLVDGSSNVAWWFGTIGLGLVLFAAWVAFGLDEWLRRASPAQQWAYLVGSLLLLLAAVAVYLVWQTVALWWLAPLAALPLYAFLIVRSEPRGSGGDGADGGFPPTPPEGGEGV